jgi:hypothetical protein
MSNREPTSAEKLAQFKLCASGQCETGNRALEPGSAVMKLLAKKDSSRRVSSAAPPRIQASQAARGGNAGQANTRSYGGRAKDR